MANRELSLTEESRRVSGHLRYVTIHFSTIISANKINHRVRNTYTFHHGLECIVQVYRGMRNSRRYRYLFRD